MPKKLLLAGGDTDPQMLRLIKRANHHGIQSQLLLTGKSGTPKASWNIKDNLFLENGIEISATAAFVRRDVFAFLKSGQALDQSSAHAWYVMVQGWLRSQVDIQICNRQFLSNGGVNKPHVLRLAIEHGLNIADSYVTNDIELINGLLADDLWVHKPIAGGGYCKVLSEFDNEHEQSSLLFPYIVQQCLEPPELRVFRVGDQWFGFNVISDALDYRTSRSTRIKASPVEDELIEKLKPLSDQLGLDFAAADFKTCSKTKELQFLEINSNPMFAGFDNQVDGALSDAILKHIGVLV